MDSLNSPSSYFTRSPDQRERFDLLCYNLLVPSGSNSAVECDLAKVEVAGSNPVSRSNFIKFFELALAEARVFGVRQAASQGAVPKW